MSRPTLQDLLAQTVRDKDAAYLERNRCVALIARMALAMGLRVGVARTAIEGWSPDWHGCVYIDLPTGQASWHYHDSQAALFADLPAYLGTWDGHSTPQKYERLAAAFPVGAQPWFQVIDPPLSLAAIAMLRERMRQRFVEGWTPEHDAGHDPGELAAAGAAYALAAADLLHPLSQGDGGFEEKAPNCWPWEAWSWKPSTARRMLEKAGALLLAEADKLNRTAAATGGRGTPTEQTDNAGASAGGNGSEATPL